MSVMSIVYAMYVDHILILVYVMILLCMMIYVYILLCVYAMYTTSYHVRYVADCTTSLLLKVEP
jgi:hypothetical protein